MIKVIKETTTAARARLSRICDMSQSEVEQWGDRYEILRLDDTPRGAALSADESIEVERGDHG